MRDGIFNTIQQGFHQIIIEGDNLKVIGATTGSSGTPWRIHSVLTDIRHWQASGVTLIFKHSYREANRAGDWVANVGHSITQPFISDFSFLSELRSIISEDVVGRSFVRKGA